MEKKKKIIILITTLTFLIASAFSFDIYKSFFKENSNLENSAQNQENKELNEIKDNFNEEEPKKEDKEKQEKQDENKKTEDKQEEKNNFPKKETNTKKEENTESKKDNSPTYEKENTSSSNNAVSSKPNISTSPKEDTKKPSSNIPTTKPNEDTSKPSGTPQEETDELDILRKKIENTYGIKIKYGKEIGSYKPKRLTPTILSDKEKIKKELNLINNELKKYPSGFFREFSGMPLTIYLVSSVPGNAFSGFTDREFMNDIKITLTENYFFEYTLNHELMHYIDAYLEIKMYPDNPYDEYMALNPQDFNYGTINKAYNYGNNGVIRGAFFIDDYAQSSVREDRAELFKNMITRLYKPAGMFDNGEVLQKKALIIDKQIRQYFKSVNGSAYWDKIVK